MKHTTVASDKMPIAKLAINKSRLKVYETVGTLPTYYLQKGTQFQIELFNPTTDTVLAKIYLNGKTIAQGGLVLRPGEKVFLERYIDVAKKFLFDTYEVSNTEEVKAAIKNNGNFKVEFYKETQPIYVPPVYYPPINVKPWNGYQNDYNTNSYNLRDIGNTYYNSNDIVGSLLTNNVSTDSLSISNNTTSQNLNDYKKNVLRSRSVLSKSSIETGILEKGSDSSQKLQTVDKTFQVFPFHTVAYKMLPISQKINNTDDLKVRIYCHNCGTRLKENHKFCSACGTKV